MDDLNHAIEVTQEAVKNTSTGIPECARRLKNLGTLLGLRFESTKSVEDCDWAIAVDEKAFKTDTATPSVRIEAASFCSQLLIERGDFNGTKDMLREAVRLIPAVSPRHFKRQFNISKVFNITSRIVSLCLQDGEDEYASLKLLESGGGILAHLMLEARSEIPP